MLTRERIKQLIYIALIVLFSVLILFVLYSASMPNTYTLKVGDKAEESIVSTRPVINEVATERRALEQANQVSEVFLRSDAIAMECIVRLDNFVESIQIVRASLDKTYKRSNISNIPLEAIDKEAEKIVKEIDEKYKISLNISDVRNLLSLEESIYQSVINHVMTIASTIMADQQDSYSLSVAISTQVANVIENNTHYRAEYSLIGNILRVFLKPNMIIDQVASEAAKEAARQKVWESPILIPVGSVIVSAGETITQSQYNTLVELDLIETGKINFSMLFSLIALFLFSVLILWIYIHYYEKHAMRTVKDWVIIMITIAIVIMLSVYAAQYNMLLMPVYYLAIIISTYYGLRTSLIFTSLTIFMLYPVTGLEPKFLFVMILTSWTAALIAASQAKTKNYLSIIIGTTLASVFASLVYSAMTQESTNQTVTSMLLSSLNGGASSVLAIGLSPLYEAAISQVSPTRLIRLSEPSHPLLRKLFLEAPGTYQHSMMIANLAETAAERIGADALLVRVGAYYHDVGKSWNASMYTENQQGFNPHSLLTTDESVSIIMRHVSHGEELGKRYRLPQEIIDFMLTHHGTTVLQYFFVQAQKEAEALGIDPPDHKDFTYPGKKPNSKETGIFMLADTVEAAMKSSGHSHLDEAEKLIRKLVKTKIEQNQLVNSGLSFHEVEEIIQAFLQVYAGQFHERIKYPDANTIPQSTN